ncbi:t-SNARE domain-containing 1 isoform X1, partial [Brachionus plicatilis]
MANSSNYQNYSANNSVDQINNNLANSFFRLKQNVNQLIQLKKQIGSSKDTIQFRDKIHGTFQKSNQIINEIQSYFKQLSSFNSSESEIALTKSKRIFEDELKTYSSLQKEIRDNLQLKPLKSYDENSEDTNVEIVDEKQALLQNKKLGELDQQIGMVRDREIKMKQIENDIIDINAIMSDLATMVNEQNSLIDNISSNVESTHGNVHYANENLAKASRYA